MNIKKTGAFLVALLVAAALVFPQQRYDMVIREGVPIIQVAIPKFLVRGSSDTVEQAARTLREVLIADLDYSRVFKPLQESFYDYVRPLDPEKIFFKEWESIGGKLLVAGEVSPGEGGAVVFEAKLYDIKSQQFIRGKSYQADASLLRTAAHRFADLMMEQQGETPYFNTKIVFNSDRDGNWELYMMDYDGHNQTRLTFNQTQDYMPAWSADGRAIAYTAYENGKASLWLLKIYEGERQLIFDRGTCYGANFSWDGKWLAFCSSEDEANHEIYVAPANGNGRPRRLTHNRASDTAPSWSPNSREIAFTSDRSGTPQIYIMDAEGSNVRKRSFGGTYHDGPAWSPTGERIVYVSRVEAIFDLYVLNLHNDRIIKLTEGYSRNESPCWSPDGRHIIFSSNRTGTIQLYSIDYDGANLRRLTSRGENKLPSWSRK